MRNLATRSRPEGASSSVVERFITTVLEEARAKGIATEEVIRQRLASLSEMVGGYDFAEVISQYWKGHDSANEALKSDAVRWLRGEFSTRTDARKALGVRAIVDDENVYDHLKLLARFLRLAGYGGLLICLDEMVNLYKLSSGKARNANYEQLLRIVNDCLQGSAEGLGFLFAGTPEFLMNPRKGLYGYEALRSRLAENRFAAGGLVDYGGPVLRLENLTPEDLFVLLQKLRHVYASGDPSQYLVPDEALKAFLEHCSKKIGEAYFRTPRGTVKAFVDFLAVLDQNRQVPWQELLGKIEIPPEVNEDRVSTPLDAEPEVSQTDTAKRQEWTDDDLASFKL
jgi:hypothetical protein